MNNTYILFKVFFINFSRLNELKESSTAKKRFIYLLWVGISLVIILVCGYNIIVAQQLTSINQQNLIPSYMVSISSFTILFLTIFYSNDILFNGRDTEQLLSFPISVKDIVKSKLIFIYVFNFVLALVFMLPCGVIWVLNSNFDIFKFILYFCSMLFIPLFPMIIASLLGIGIILLSSLFKNHNIMTLIISALILGFLILWAIYSMQTNYSIANIETILSRQIIKLYPLSIFFSTKLINHGGIGILYFITISIIVFLLFTKIVSLQYREIILLTSKAFKHKNYKVITKKKSPVFSLYIKDLKKFINSYMSILNTGLGVILLFILSIILIIIPIHQIDNYIGIKDIETYLSSYAPILISSFLCLSCTTAYSISIEGDTIWILQSSPIRITDLLNSKLALNLTIHAFGHLVAVIAFITKLNINFIQLLSILVIPIIYSIFISMIGLFLNKKYPNFDWDNEMIIVKQSLPVIATGIIGTISILIPIIITLAFSISITYTIWIWSLFLTMINFYIYKKMCEDKYI